MQRFIDYLTLFVFFVFLGRSAAFQEKLKFEKPDLVFKAPVKHLYDGFYTSTVDLGRLEAGTKYNIELWLINPHSEDVNLDSTRTSCKCSGFKADGKLLKRDGRLKTQLSISVPKSTKDGKFGFSVDGYDAKGKHVLRVNGRAELKGNIHIDNTKSLFEVGDGVSEIRIPISFSDPVKGDSISAYVSDGLESCVTKVDTRGGKSYLVITVHRDVMDGSYIAGFVGIKDKNSGLSARLDIIISKSRPFVLSPSVPRFVEIPKSKPKRFRAKLFLQVIDPSLLPSDKKKISIRCTTVDGNRVPVQVKPLSKSVFQLQVELTESDLTLIDREKEKELNWSFGFKPGSMRSTTSFVLLRR